MTERRWRRWLRVGTNVEKEVDDELRFHLDMLRDELERRGLDPNDAKRAAESRFGNTTQIRDTLRSHDINRERRFNRRERMHDFFQDLRYAVRGFARSPGFTIVAVVTLALGIGATTAIFSVVNGVLLRPLPFPAPHRLVNVWMDNRRMGMAEDIHSYPNLEDLRTRNRSFEEIAAYTRGGANLTGGCQETECEPRRVNIIQARASLWKVLGVAPASGRTFTVEEETQGQDGVVVLSDALWTQQFGADRSIIGRQIRLNGRERTVIGIMPPSFRFPATDTHLWIPLALPPQAAQSRSGYFLWAIGRLKPGVTMESARTDLTGVARQLENEYPENKDLGTHLVAMEEQIVGRTMRTALWVMLAAVGAVLLIACANVANLMLSRAAVREREIGVRLALGAGRGRLVRQLLTESVALATAGALTGLGLAWAILKLLKASAPADVANVEGVALDGTVLMVALLLTVVTGLIFGLAPALQASRQNTTQALREGGRGSGSSRTAQRLRRTLAGAQVALVVVLLTSSGLLVRSFLALQRTDLGFTPENLLVAEVSLAGARYQQGPARVAFYEQVFERLRANPGVVSVGAIRDVFLSPLPNSAGFTIEGRERTPDIANMEVPIDPVTPDYFRSMGIPLLEGRVFTSADADTAAPAPVIINETMSRTFWPAGDALGKRIKYGDEDSNAPWLTIVGVVADMRRTGYDAPVRNETFLPHARNPSGGMEVVIRTRSDPSNAVQALRDAVRAVDPEQPVHTISSMEARLGEMVSQRRFAMVLLVTFAALALALGLVGVYGVTSYLVTQRLNEMGVRIALGAPSAQVVGMVVRQGMVVAAVGLVVGLAAAVGTTRLLGSLLYGVSPLDAATFGGAAAALLVATLLANWIPARRAATADPLAVLRAD